MKDLIERLKMWQGPLAIEAADALEQQAAVIEQMREALNSIKSQNATIEMRRAATLQPCPEVLNKVRADAVAEFCAEQRAFEIYKSIKLLPQRDKDFMEQWVAQRIKKGEVE